MSIWPRRLRTRLLLSYVVVVLAGAAAMFVVGTVVTRTVYERQLGGFGFGQTQGRGQGRGGSTVQEVTRTELETALDRSLLPALLAGAGAALVTAVVVAWLLGRRLLRPLDEVGAATRRMAAGDYSVQVPVPSEVELASLARDVNELGEHLATTEHRRTQLLGEVTHELRTPITVIRGQIEGMLDGVIQPSDEVYVAVADEAARLQRLVDDLTLLSRAEEGALDVHLAPLDLATLAAAAAERLEPQFAHQQVALLVERHGEVRVLGDADRLTQVVTNLLGNALGHTPAGGTVTVRVERRGTVGQVEVIDTGSGIPVTELEHIFDRFYRLPDAGGRAGRGIGLTIARSLARAHGGDVVAESQGPGTGSTFRLTIPT